jgi:hypothetical protein
MLSPEMLPPTFTHKFQRCLPPVPQRLRAGRESAVVVENQRVQVAVTSMENIGHAVAMAFPPGLQFRAAQRAAGCGESPRPAHSNRG